MSKNHRGKGLRDQAARGRGECPVCKRKNVKILYEQEAGEQKFKICKTCRAAIKHGKKSLPTAAPKPAEASAAAPEAVAAPEASPAEKAPEVAAAAEESAAAAE